MKRFGSPVAALVLAAAVCVLATPTFAQRSQGGAPGMSAARAQAIRECTARAAKYVEHTWGDTEIALILRSGPKDRVSKDAGWHLSVRARRLEA